MKIFHDHNEDGSWTEITTISKYPMIRTRLDAISNCSFIINDFEGALYSTWSGYNFIPIKVEDDSSHILFRGYLTGKSFKHNQLTCTLQGLAAKLSWVPIHKNYILAEGLVKNVPSEEILPNVVNIYPNGDFNVNWNDEGGGNDFDTVNSINGVAIYAGDGDEGAIEEFNLGTIADVTEATSVTLYIYGKYVGQDTLVHCDFYNGTAYQGQKDYNFGSTYSWVSQTWAGLSMNQAALDASMVRIIADNTYGAPDAHFIDAVYIEVTYTGINPESLDLTDNGGDAFTTWGVDGWTDEIDAGILIRDTTANWDIKTYNCSAVAAANHTGENGNAASITGKNDYDRYQITDTGELNALSVITLDGDNIDSLTQTIKQIDIKYNLLFRYDSDVLLVKKYAIIEIRYNKDDNDWRELVKIERVGDGSTGWVGGTATVKGGSGATLAKFLDKTGDNWDCVEQIRIRMESSATCDANNNYIMLDYLEAKVSYYEVDTAPIMEKITDNGASWLICDGVNWTDLKVEGETAPDAADGDSFQIGMGSMQVLEEIFGESGVGLQLDTTLTYYIAQHYKGTYTMDILKKICLLEGLHWWEDHVNNQIIISAKDDMEDSTEDLTQADYGYNWEFEDDNNYVSAVEVYGAAAYSIYYKAVSDTSDSPKTKTIIEETLLTNVEAKKVADNELAEHETKKPSIRIPLIGVYENLTVGKTVGLTMVRPTVVEADYPIRMIERSKFGGNIETIIYCGLGHSTNSEKIANLINASYETARKAHTDRLISTPYGAGASLTWSDIGGAQTAVESIIDTEVGAGESIDDAIDALILTHKNDADAHEDRYTKAEADAAIDADILTHKNISDAHHALPTDYYTKTEMEAFLQIGTGNKIYGSCIYIGTTVIGSTKGGNLFANTNATDHQITFDFPIPLMRGGLNLYLDEIKIGIWDADAGDYLSQINLYGWRSYTTLTNIYSEGTNRTAKQEYTYAVGTTQIGTTYKRLQIILTNVVTNAADLDIEYVLIRYWYA